jgi:predicted type IV restriction endonuclease
MPSATIKLFLAYGDAKRLRTAEISNWTGKAIAGPRNEFELLLKREEAEKPGIYFLTGCDIETGKNTVYIGEAECVRERIKTHLDKDYWNHAIFFISKDENLTKAHIRYLEGRIIEQARQLGRVSIHNSQGSGAKLPESDREDMEIFLGRIHQLLPVLGADFLQPIAAPSKPEDLLHCEIKGHRATGSLNATGFVVFAKSQAVIEERPSAHRQPWLVKLRQTLQEDGVLKEEGGKFVFAKNTEFSSPSTAAGVIHGGSTNGLEVWRNQHGKSLKQLEAI